MALFGSTTIRPFHFPEALGMITPVRISPDPTLEMPDAFAIELFDHYKVYNPPALIPPAGDYDELAPPTKNPLISPRRILPLTGVQLHRTLRTFRRISNSTPVKIFASDEVADYKLGVMPSSDKIRHQKNVIETVIEAISQQGADFESSLCVLRVFAELFREQDDIFAQTLNETRMTAILSLWPKDQMLLPDSTNREGRSQILNVMLQVCQFDESARQKTAAIFGAVWRGLSDDDFMKLLKNYEDILIQASQVLEAKKSHYIEEFIGLLQNSPWVFPYTAEEIHRLLSDYIFEISDPIRHIHDNVTAQNDMMMGRIRISLVNLLFNQHKDWTTHELLHTLAQPTMVLMHSGDHALRLGLTILSLNFFGISGVSPHRRPYLTWIDEALVQYLAMVLTGVDPNQNEAYPSEVRLFRVMLDSGISLQLFIDAMCEPIFLDDPQRHHVALRTLIAEIEKKFGPDFLKKTDRLWKEDHGRFQRLSWRTNLFKRLSHFS